MNNKHFLFCLALASGFSATMADSFNVFMKDGRVVEYTTDIVDSVVFVKAGETLDPVTPVIPSDTADVTPSVPTTPGVVATQGDIKILTTGGWFESCFATWSAYSGASKYKVSVKKASDNQYIQIDDALIRNYGNFFRADALGLAAGDYNLSVVAVDANGKEICKPSVSKISVKAHDRSGFAFSNGNVPGAYNMDGTLKKDAIVLYMTEKTKDKVSADIVTSSNGTTTSAQGIQNILTLYKKGYDARPLCIRIVGNVSDPAITDKGDILLDLGGTKQKCAGVTIEGVGEDAVANGWGVRIKNAQLVEVRNIGTMNCDSGEGDNIGLQQSCEYVWVHNCDFFYGDAGSDADQVKGDGALDCKKSTYITFSYNHFFDNGKCNLLGLSEGTTDGLYITYHHNWYDHSDSRHPRVRYYSAHVYNNYYDGIAKYGIGSTLGSSIFSENNYFRSCKFPMLTSMQGSDLYAEDNKSSKDNGTFSGEAGGTIKSFGNKFEGKVTYVSYNNTISALKGGKDTRGINGKSDFDFYEASSRNEKVPSSVTSLSGGNTYNNFDTNSSVMYTYTPDSAEQAVENVKAFAGRQNGGDFKWTFTTDEDESYAVNAALKSALTNYKTLLKNIQGE